MVVKKEEAKVFAENRKARHDYFVEDTYEAGISLKGTEVKSIRSGRVNLRDSYARVENGLMLVYNMHISPYEQGNRFNHDPERPKQLLLHKREIMKLFDKTRLEGYTLVPLEVYLKDGRIKMALGVCRGKRMYDKRDAAADRDMAREAARAMRDRERGA